jgi:deoxyribonuclease V
MIGCVDVHYQDRKATAALVLFSDWSSETVVAQSAENVDGASAYIPGQFYKRELPCVLSVIRASSCEPSILLIDGYVWLGVNEDGEQVRGLGAHLFDELNQRIAIIGVAKTHYKSSKAIPVCRGTSRRPIYVSAAGIDVHFAAECVRRMHGKNRLPTMVKLADQLARHANDVNEDRGGLAE